MKDNCIILTGGGTAGHVTVNINLQDELFKHFNKVVYIGSKTGIEKTLIKTQTKYEYEEIDSCKLIRKKIFQNLKIPFVLSRAIKQAKLLIKKHRPSVVFSKGGYVGLPVVIAAKKLGVPVVCHESDFSIGLANKIAKSTIKLKFFNFFIFLIIFLILPKSQMAITYFFSLTSRHKKTWDFFLINV